MKKLNLLLLCFLCLVGCKQEAIINTTLSDLTSKDCKFVYTELNFMVPSKQEFNKSKAFLKEKLEDVFEKDVSSLEFYTDGFKSMVRCSVKIPIQNKPTSKNLLSIIRKDDLIGIHLNREKFDFLRKTIKNNYYADVDPSKLEIKLIVKNDIDKESIKVYPNFVNDFCVLTQSKMKMRNFLKIKLSNLSVMYMYNNNFVPVLKIQ